ncbi:MAG: hypothetical protein IT444_04035 [Phycisphaeraceae bacterium]|nr:hypothetical protein [Phycisphaeraceae bacterium]
MLFLAASQPRSEGFLEVLTQIFSRIDTLANPGDLLRHVQNLSLVWGAILLAAGLLCLFQGAKYYKVVTVIFALAVGGIVGYALSRHMNAAPIVSGCLAALFAVICWPLMKYAVAIMGGIAGAFLGANAWTAIAATAAGQAENGGAANASKLCWVGALMGLIICGMLAFVLFKVAIVFFTSVSGATVALIGALCLLTEVKDIRVALTDNFGHNALVLPLLMIVPACIGLILQHTSPDKGQAAAASKPAPKPA